MQCCFVPLLKFHIFQNLSHVNIWSNHFVCDMSIARWASCLCPCVIQKERSPCPWEDPNSDPQGYRALARRSRTSAAQASPLVRSAKGLRQSHRCPCDPLGWACGLLFGEGCWRLGHCQCSHYESEPRWVWVHGLGPWSGRPEEAREFVCFCHGPSLQASCSLLLRPVRWAEEADPAVYIWASHSLVFAAWPYSAGWSSSSELDAGRPMWWSYLSDRCSTPLHLQSQPSPSLQAVDLALGWCFVVAQWERGCWASGYGQEQEEGVDAELQPTEAVLTEGRARWWFYPGDWGNIADPWVFWPFPSREEGAYRRIWLGLPLHPEPEEAGWPVRNGRGRDAEWESWTHLHLNWLVWSGPGGRAVWKRIWGVSGPSWAPRSAVAVLCWGSSRRWTGPPAPSASLRGRARSAAQPEARRSARPCCQNFRESRQIFKQTRSPCSSLSVPALEKKTGQITAAHCTPQDPPRKLS